MNHRRGRRALAGLAIMTILGAGTSACGGDPAVCSDTDSLRSSIQDLQNIDIGQGGLAQLQKQLEAIRSDLQQLADDASDQYSSEVAAIRDAVDALGASLTAAVSTPSAATLTAVRDDVKALGSSVARLGDAVSGTC
ncbi:hypothetical protein [Nocardioides mesophilus]|uniref:Secreted protein n=1 Tax=Nocardioides mesophilus TaxID=433659 RepID=A0A7G9RB46_9ACTN|nr:hypothetical protein [Nocardioides mesophilus]QNN52821.1 hypothetical protein H9L09_20745 [Nocardioides mesophilus]